jgi:hypothetical protein
MELFTLMNLFQSVRRLTLISFGISADQVRVSLSRSLWSELILETRLPQFIDR